MTIRTILTGTIIAGGLAAIVAGGPGAAAEEPVRGGTLNAGISALAGLNPAVRSGIIVQLPGAQLFAGLVDIGPDFEPLPYLAQSWEISDDSLVHTFRLVEDAVFHDGTPITAADAAFSLEVVRDNHPFGRIMHGGIESIEVLDAHTLAIRHSVPTPYFLQTLAAHLMPVLPQHIYDDGTDILVHPRNQTDVVGSGPFVQGEYRPGEYLVLERFDQFFRDGRPYLDQIVMRSISDPATRLLSFERGDVDIFPHSGFHERDVLRLQNVSGIQIVEEGYAAVGHVTYLDLNLRRQPFDDVRVRRALSHLIDRERLSRTQFLGIQVPAYSILHPENPYFSPETPRFDDGLEAAEALLDEAGVVRGSDGVRFSMTIDVLPGPQYPMLMSEYIRGQFRRAGIEVTLRNYPDFGSWAGALASWEYDGAANTIWNYPHPAIGVHRLFACDNIRNIVWTNTQGYCSEEVDALMSEAAQETDAAERIRLYAELQQILAEDMALMPLIAMNGSTAQHDRVLNAPLGAWGALAPWDAMQISAD